MDFRDFESQLLFNLEELNIKIGEEEVKKLYNYMKILLKWNDVMNLTSIVEPKEIITKHFEDSLTINKYIKDDSKIIDVGTGAGFPGIPLAICRKNVNITLLDSLNKRINFLNEVIEDIDLNNCIAVHGRAEDLGRTKNYREEYDVAVSRAVAPLNVLVEYLLPFVKVGGICICMKGPKIEEELININTALEKLGGKIEEQDRIMLQGQEIQRNIIIIKKVAKTSMEYPRKAGIPSKKPL